MRNDRGMAGGGREGGGEQEEVDLPLGKKAQKFGKKGVMLEGEAKLQVKRLSWCCFMFL